MRGQFATINLRQRYQPGNQRTHRIQKIENREEWRALPPGRRRSSSVGRALDSW